MEEVRQAFTLVIDSFIDTTHCWNRAHPNTGEWSNVFDRHGQHEIVVVIGVLADDIDTAGRDDNPAWRATIVFLKFSSNVGGEFLEVHGKINRADFSTYPGTT
jgi:hypothetical protein